MALDSSPDFSFAGGQTRIPMPADTGEIRRRANHSYDGTHEFKFRDDGTVQIRRRSGNRWVYVETIRTDTSPGVTIYAKGETWINGTVKGRVTSEDREYQRQPGLQAQPRCPQGLSARRT